MKLAVSLILAGMAALLALVATLAHAQGQLTEADPADSGVLETPAEVVHLCFSQAVNVTDKSTFSFTYRMANGSALGMRIVFEPDGSEEASGALHDQVGEGGATAANPSAIATPLAGGGSVDEGGDGGGPDILLMALLTIAVAGGAAVVATLGYLLRRAIGFDLHRPPEGEEDGGGH